MSDIDKSSGVVFLLGAGASVEAEVPDTFAFVEQFQRSITTPTKRATVDKVICKLRNWKPSETDVELLLETLTKLEARKEEPLLKFIEGGRFILSGFTKKAPIIDDLKRFIKEKSIIELESRIRYFEPLLGFVEEHKPLDIISVNYDTCIEHFCSVYRRSYQDGFDANWNPKLFAQANMDIRLYKLHGSATWYRTDRGNYVKSAVRTKEPVIKLITGEKAETLILYPMQKLDYAGPLLELLVRAKNVIQDASCRFLVVVGYSFRDEHITKIILEAAKENEGLALVIVDPKASQIYRKKLKYFDSRSRIPTHLDGRVVCLPYKFAKALPALKDHYLSSLREGLSLLSSNTSKELRGEHVDWFGCLERLAEAEHTEKLQWLLKSKMDGSELENRWDLNVKVALRMSLNLAANGQRGDAKKHLMTLKKILHGILFENSEIHIEEAPSGFVIGFVFYTQKAGPHRNRIEVQQLRSSIQREYDYLLSRSQMTMNSQFIEDFRFIDSIMKYLDSLEFGRVTFDRFASSRERYAEDLQSMIDTGSRLLQESKPELKASLSKTLAGQVREIEKKVIAGILS